MRPCDNLAGGTALTITAGINPVRIGYVKATNIDLGVVTVYGDHTTLNTPTVTGRYFSRALVVSWKQFWRYAGSAEVPAMWLAGPQLALLPGPS